MQQAELKSLLWYEPETGVFRWRVAQCKRKIWSIAGSKNDGGYVLIQIKGKKYGAHRLAFLYMTGQFPEKLVDHKNRITFDNRWCNLRKADVSQNQWNASKRIDNKSGVRVVYFCKTWKRWIAAIRVNGVKHDVGRFDTKQEAQNAVIKFRSNHHGEYAN